MIKTLLMVFLGGGLGSLGRYLISTNVNKLTAYNFPLGTFIVNILGSFLLGFFLISLNKSANESAQMWSLLLITGFCGGFTTFSTFTAENFNYLQNGAYLNFFIYTLVSITIALLTIILGTKLGKLI